VGKDNKNNSAIYLTPFVPLSLIGEGEEKKRGALAPLRHPD